MQGKKTIKGKAISLILLALILFVIIYSSERSKAYYTEAIRRNPKITSGFVERTVYMHKKGLRAEYSFLVNEKYYYGKRGYSILNTFQKVIVGKSFPVVYNSADPTKNMILILPEDFKAFNLDFPDSLNWVKKFL